MQDTLYFSRNPNPRLGLAVARYLGAPVSAVFASYSNPDQRAVLEPLNPNGLLPVLSKTDGPALWETDAIACYLSRSIGSNFWRQDDDQPDMMRWIIWGHQKFVAACDLVNWERATKPRYGIGPTDQAGVDQGLRDFRAFSAILSDALADRHFLLGETPSYADFRMATFLPYLLENRLPIDEFPILAAWNDRLNAIPAWADPFDGLDVPELPRIP